MKITIIVNDLSVRGGTQKQVLRLCQYLTDAGEAVQIVTRFYDESKAYSDFQSFKINYLHQRSNDKGNNKSILSKICSRIYSVLDEYRLVKMIPSTTNIINMHDNGLPRLIRIIKRWIPAAKIVWQINDLPNCFSVGVSRNRKHGCVELFDRVLYRMAVRHVDTITVNVSKNKTEVMKCLNREACVYYCGVDSISSASARDGIRSGMTVNLLTTGVFFAYRNYEVLLSVVRRFSNSEFDVHLDIVGDTTRDPEYAEKIVEMIKSEKLAEKVKIWGQVNEETYRMLLDKANIFAFVNVNQSWGLAVFEAMGNGIPVIVSRSVGAVEILNDQVDSVFVDPSNVEEIYNCIEQLIVDDEKYRSISQSAIDHVKNLSWKDLYCEPIHTLFCNTCKIDKEESY